MSNPEDVLLGRDILNELKMFADGPVQIFYRKMEDRDELIDPDALTREEIIS